MLRFGLYLPQLRMDFGVIGARVRVAEEEGFDSVWLMDHLAAPGLPEADTLEAWTVATALAARTDRIRIGHLVLNAVLRHPALLAKMAASLDVISDGRLELGLGWGSVPAELRAWGFGDEAPRVRAARLRETVEIVSLLLSGEPVTYMGNHYRLDAVVARPTPVQDKIPIHIGGAGTRFTLPLVTRHADWWNCPSSAVHRIEELRPLTGTARVSVQHPIGLAAAKTEVEEVRSVAQRRFGGWGGLVCGTPEAVAEVLSREAAQGVEMFIVQLSDFGDPTTIRRFAREVIPAVEAHPAVRG